MKLKARVAKIVAAAKEEVWGQVFQSDNLFLVVEISVPEEHEAAPLGKEVINALSSKFDQLNTRRSRDGMTNSCPAPNGAGVSSLSKSNRLKSVTPASNINLKNLKKLVSLKNGSFLNLQIPEGTSLNILLCALVNNVFYLLVLGQGKAFLKRGEKLATLLKGQGSGSGILDENDLLILTSPKFSQIISFESLKSTLNLPFQEIAENLAPLVHAQENSFGAAAMILRIEKEEEEEREVEKEEKTVPLALPFKKKISSLREKFLRIKPSFILKRRVSDEERTKKTVLTVVLILTALLLISIIFGFGKKRRSLQEEKFQGVFETATHKFEGGRALLGLNTQKSRELLGQAKELLEAAKDEFKKGSKERRKIEALLQEVEGVLKEAEKVYKLDQVPLFFDPVFLKDKAFGEDLALYKDNLAILDKKENTLYHLLLKEKKGKIIAGGENFKGLRVVGIHGDKVYTLVEEGIMELQVTSYKLQVIIKKDDEWGEIIDLVAYRGNVYLLDKKEIAKYLKTEEGLAKRDYLAPGTKVDFSSATSMAIDGDIWVAKAGEVLKFSLGQRKEFLPKGLEIGLGGNLLLYTDEECENIYLLDKEQKRIVVLNKEGEYQAQYEWERMGQVQSLVVSEKEGKILVLVEGKIYEIEIK